MFKQFGNGQQNKHGFILLPKLLHPKSVGTIRLRSQNPFDYPLIDPKYLEEEVDVEILLDGNYFTNNLIPGKQDPGCKDHKYRSDDYWRYYIRHNTLTVYHPTTTCVLKMTLQLLWTAN